MEMIYDSCSQVFGRYIGYLNGVVVFCCQET